MALQDFAERAKRRIRRMAKREPDPRSIVPFTGSIGDVSVTCDLERVFRDHQGRVVHKWLHYLPIYERHLSRYRGTSFRMLEIGVNRGGSLQMWREYFGTAATICGIDIDPACAAFNEPPNVIRIGSQDDPVFLHSVIEEIGGLDVVLDDGSHIGRHQVASFEALWPVLADGGLYIIEDLHTSYWPGPLEGGYRRQGTGIEFGKTLVDDMHHWYHDHARRTDVSGVYFYDSIVVIEKRIVKAPKHVKVGQIFT